MIKYNCSYTYIPLPWNLNKNSILYHDFFLWGAEFHSCSTVCGGESDPVSLNSTKLSYFNSFHKNLFLQLSFHLLTINLPSWNFILTVGSLVQPSRERLIKTFFFKQRSIKGRRACTFLTSLCGCADTISLS